MKRRGRRERRGGSEDREGGCGEGVKIERMVRGS